MHHCTAAGCRADKKAFERKMKAKQQQGKKTQDRREATKAERAAESKLAVFEDDVLGCVSIHMYMYVYISKPKTLHPKPKSLNPRPKPHSGTHLG